MIICPKCQTVLTKKPDRFECAKCSYEARISKGVACFNPEINDDFADYDPGALEVFYQHENKHFWFRIRQLIVKDLFNKYVKKNAKVIEIGAGTGYISKMLMTEGYEVAVGDVHLRALSRFNGRIFKEKYQFDINQAPFKDHFDAVGMFDVLEHIENDNLALKNVSGMLKDQGKLILTVPAHRWLWNRHDYSHKRRYRLSRIRKLMKKNDFKILEAKHFFVSIVPMLFLRALLQKPDNEKISARKLAEEQVSINPILNNILFVVLWCENKILKMFSPKIGGSILVVAEKSETICISSKMIPFNKPLLTGRELHYLEKVLESRKLSGDGQFTKRCNRWFEKNFDCEKALLTTSCSHALDMAALIIDIRPGDEVIMCPLTLSFPPPTLSP